MKETNRTGRDPYYYWKMVNMVLACAVLILAILIILGEKGGLLIPITFFLGLVMSSLSGIMELAKNKRVIGYTCSVFAGILAVALIISIIGMWWK